jgi:MFS family permease
MVRRFDLHDGRLGDVRRAALYAYEQTESAFASGAVLTALTLPGLLIGTVASVFVDRWNRKRTMVVANLIQVLVMLPLLLVPSEILLASCRC